MKTLEQRISILEKRIFKGRPVTEAIQKVLGSRIKVYDNGGKSLDRITIVFLDFELENNRFYQAIAADESGHGFYSHTSVQLGRHLGKEIPFSSLSPFIQKEVTEEIREYNSYNESKAKKRVKESGKTFNLNDILEVLDRYKDGRKIMRNMNKYQYEVDEIYAANLKSKPAFEKAVVDIFNLKEEDFDFEY